MGGGGVDSQGRCADLRPEGASALGHQRHCARHLLPRLDVNKGAEIRGQALSEIHDDMKVGIRAFLFSGYPHLQECETFGTKVLPQLKTVSLPHAYGRVPAQMPTTPLGVRH